MFLCLKKTRNVSMLDSSKRPSHEGLFFYVYYFARIDFMNKGILLLTSTGLSSEAVVEKFKELVLSLKNKRVAMITTASEGKESNKYSVLAKKQLVDMGFFQVDFIDFETEPSRDLSPYGIIYVCGGNTFKLLKYAKEANFKDSITNLFKRDGIYIGVSAGSIIVGPSIQIAGEIEADSNDVNLEDLNGLDITNLVILPHYSPKLEEETKIFELKYGVKAERINNSQAILVENGKKTVIE